MKRKTIAFKAMVFLFWKFYRLRQKMFKQPGSRITLVMLAFCLCLGSQAILPISNVVSASMLEVSEIDFDQTEFEEDLFATIAGLIFSKSGLMNLDFQTTSLLPVSPPPKHT